MRHFHASVHLKINVDEAAGGQLINAYGGIVEAVKEAIHKANPEVVVDRVRLSVWPPTDVPKGPSGRSA